MITGSDRSCSNHKLHWLPSWSGQDRDDLAVSMSHDEEQDMDSAHAVLSTGACFQAFDWDSCAYPRSLSAGLDPNFMLCSDRTPERSHNINEDLSEDIEEKARDHQTGKIENPAKRAKGQHRTSQMYLTGDLYRRRHATRRDSRAKHILQPSRQAQPGPDVGLAVQDHTKIEGKGRGGEKVLNR